MFPKNIHLTCKDKLQLDSNETFKMCFNKYLNMYPDYDIKIYFDEDIYQIVRDNFPEDYEFIKNINGVCLADTFRYLILYLKGGIYSDLDCLPIINIEKLFNNLHYHGTDNNMFFIYPENKPLINNKWDYYKNECDHCKLINQNEIQTYECLGHNYISNNTNIVIGKENFTFDKTNPYNNSRLCQWFLISKSNQNIFLDCYKECILNLKNNYEKIQKLKKTDPEYFISVLNTTGPFLFTKKINMNLYDNNICILPVDFFCCGSGSNQQNFKQQSKNSYVKHLYNGSWLN
jgi:hypothetical protein